MRQRKLVCCLLCWLAATSCCAAGKEQRRLDNGGVPLDVGYRENGDYPSPRCCMAGSCSAPKAGQHAFVTSVRTGKYVPLLKQLVCSLAESNPGELGLLLWPSTCSQLLGQPHPAPLAALIWPGWITTAVNRVAQREQSSVIPRSSSLVHFMVHLNLRVHCS
jgi:hypothetical protein